MSFETLIHKMSQAAVAGDGRAVGACFCENGTYHDVFYGAFQGRAAIAEMIEHYFHRDASDFIWDIHDPVSNGEIAYARYIFSYTSRLSDARGKRALFEGICTVKLKDGLILDYHEVASHGAGMTLLGFAAERIVRLLQRQADELQQRPETAHHQR